MSDLNHNEHKKLIQSELIYQTNEFKKLLNKQSAKLFVEHHLYICRYQGFDELRGNILVSFNHKICHPPRKNENLLCFVSTLQDENVKNWGGMTYENLRTNVVTQFESKTVFFSYKNGTTIVGLSGVKFEDVNKYEKDLIVFLAPADPPLDYLFNLYHYLNETDQHIDPVLKLNINTPKWNPEPLINGDDIALRFQTDLIENDIINIQGPPGTGKTHLMSKICNAFLKANFRVLVTALTNRALIELAEKEPLRESLERGLVFKSSLTADERKNKKIKGIQAFRSISKQKPPLLLSTYYVMSQIALKAMPDNHFDYIIIEEASQAFLSTIALARKLGKKCIVIGDIMQLEPIFHKEYSLEDANNYHWMVRGLKSISYYYPNSKQYILTESYRLSQNSVYATNSFYNNMLTSKFELNSNIDFEKYSILRNNLNTNGGNSLKFFNMPEGRLPSKEIVSFILDIISALDNFNSKSEIAVLSFYRDTIRFLQSEIFKVFPNRDNLLVETIDRIQGLTTDFCIYFISKDSIPFSLNLNRFNVATSRARVCTLIISDPSIKYFTDNIPKIASFLNHTKIIENEL